MHTHLQTHVDTHMHVCAPTETHTFILATGVPEIKEVSIIHIPE